MPNFIHIFKVSANFYASIKLNLLKSDFDLLCPDKTIAILQFYYNLIHNN